MLSKYKRSHCVQIIYAIETNFVIEFSCTRSSRLLCQDLKTYQIKVQLCYFTHYALLNPLTWKQKLLQGCKTNIFPSSFIILYQMTYGMGSGPDLCSLSIVSRTKSSTWKKSSFDCLSVHLWVTPLSRHSRDTWKSLIWRLKASISPQDWRVEGKDIKVANTSARMEPQLITSSPLWHLCLQSGFNMFPVDLVYEEPILLSILWCWLWQLFLFRLTPWD